MSYFPFFMDIGDKDGLVVGGGYVALNKCRRLIPYGVRLTVVAPQVLPELEALSHVTCCLHPFSEKDLDRSPMFVLAATGNKEVDTEVSTLCKQRNIPVNVADAPELCSFIFPCLVQRGALSAGISTSGASPTAAKYWKHQFEELLPEQTEEILSWLSDQRQAVKEQYADQKTRSAHLRRMAEESLRLGRPADAKVYGSVALVGAGCGAADLITVRGLRLLRRCDAVVYDDLIDHTLLEEIPEYAERYAVGKRGGLPSAIQSEINELLITLAGQGKQVVRLKGGDPYLFGRGGEEFMALQEAGIPVQTVPGISSAIGIPSEMGIPVTHRGLSQSLHIITAHTANTPDGLPLNLEELAHLQGTLVFLMGVKQLPRLAQALIQYGKDPSTPAAILSGGCSSDHFCIRGTLGTLPALSADCKPPAVIVVGDVVNLKLNNVNLNN